jgi:hypothetical protein
MVVASLIDVEALWHVVLYSFLAVVGGVTGYGTVVLALDRVQRDEVTPVGRAGWILAMGLGGLTCLALLAVGFWAMTQK